MNKIIHTLLAFLTLMLCAPAAHAAPVANTNFKLMDSLEMRLEELNNPSDSLLTLLNIYDLALTRPQKADVIDRIIKTTTHNNNNSAKIEALTYYANDFRSNDSILRYIESELQQLPKSPRRDEALLFTHLQQIDYRLEHSTETEQSDHMVDLLKQYTSFNGQDQYEEAEVLYSLCMHLKKTTQGELLETYIDKLQQLVEHMNLPAGNVRNLVYTRAAPIFTNNGNAEAAIKVDKKMLNIIDSLVVSYEAQNRPYRTHNTSKYIVYRRMLANYKALTPEEVETFHNEVMDIVDVDVRSAADFRGEGRPEICYLLAKKRYPEAVTMIKKVIDRPELKNNRPYYLNALVEAAGATGDTHTQLKAALELNDSLQSRLNSRGEERYRELQILYDVNDLRKRNDELLLSEEKSRVVMSRIIITIVVVAFVVLCVLVVFLILQNRKMRKLAAEHFQNTVRVRAERNELRKAQRELVIARDEASRNDKLKTEFITNMSHEVKVPLNAITEYSRLILDCIPDDKKKYLDRFAYIVEENVKVLHTLINDVLDMTSLEHDNMVMNTKPESVQTICRLAFDNIFERGKGTNDNGVAVSYLGAGRQDVIANTDQVRVCQVLTNLLSNANKFTEKGKITLDYDYDEEKKTITFIVADTGIGIPDDCEELIFKRFYKVDPSTHGCGLGLYIARLLAERLNGSVVLDTDYHGGARFIFTIPA